MRHNYVAKHTFFDRLYEAGLWMVNFFSVLFFHIDIFSLNFA